MYDCSIKSFLAYKCCLPSGQQKLHPRMLIVWLDIVGGALLYIIHLININGVSLFFISK